MDYLEYKFTIKPLDPWKDLLQSDLADAGFESFVDDEDGFVAYVAESELDKNAFDNIELLGNSLCEISYSINRIKAQNWNHEWEKNFNPILIDNRCVIRAPFHPIQNLEFEIIIEPKMSFGTGHHETTHTLVSYLLDMEINKSQKVMDMGCGTGILAILCGLKGARDITAVDVDQWAYENTIENCQRNGVEFVKVFHNDAKILNTGDDYDIFIANINRNILTADMEYYSKATKSNGVILFSGFYTQDNDIIIHRAMECGFELIETRERNNWSAIKMRKK